MKVCETCKHRATPPPELAPLYEEMRRLFPKVFYCKLLNAIKCCNPQSPAQMFDCELFEPTESAQ
jgi:hypothetical protein